MVVLWVEVFSPKKPRLGVVSSRTPGHLPGRLLRGPALLLPASARRGRHGDAHGGGRALRAGRCWSLGGSSGGQNESCDWKPPGNIWKHPQNELPLSSSGERKWEHMGTHPHLVALITSSFLEICQRLWLDPMGQKMDWSRL